MDYNSITPHIFTGAAPQNSGDITTLSTAGIKYAVNCASEHDDATLFSGSGISYLFNGVLDDGMPKSASWFEASINFVLPAFGGAASLSPASPRPRVLLYSIDGINRGPSTAFAVMLALDWPYDYAEAIIRQARPSVQLRYDEDAAKAIGIMGY